jgi:exosome complex component RRP41
VLSCAINAITLALLDAGVPMSDSVLSLTLGQHLRPSCVLLDLTSAEESGLPFLTLAMLPRTKKVTLAQSESRLAREDFREMLKLGTEAIGVLQAEVDQVLKARTKRLVQAMGTAKMAPLQDEMDAMQE